MSRWIGASLNQEFDPRGLVVQETYDDGSVEVLDPLLYTISRPNMPPTAPRLTVSSGSFTARFAIYVDSSDRDHAGGGIDGNPENRL
jgi:hypothetical protein